MDIIERLHGQRTVVLTDCIDEEQTTSLLNKLLEFNLDSHREIRLLINSNGGQTQPALSICDIISSIVSPVTGIVINRCFSMALVILQTCKKRLALKHALFLPHFTTTNLHFSHLLSEEDIRALFERRYLEGRNTQRKSERLIASRSGMSIREIRRLMRDGDVLGAQLSAEEARTVGLIDRIIENPKWLFAKK